MNQRWCADNNLGDAKEETKASGITATSFSWFTAHGCGSTSGKAYVGTLCLSSRGWNTNINEKSRTAVQSGYVSIWNSTNILLIITE